MKVDVRSCFDTLPQDLLLRLVNTMLSSDDYSISRSTEVKAHHKSISKGRVGEAAKPLKKFHAVAQASSEARTFLESRTTKQAENLRRTTWVDHVARQNLSKGQVQELIAEHVRNNIVKIGKKYYRQKQGIPQGSVLSSILCNIGYADFERHHLGFLKTGLCLLLRLIDDFLVITPSKTQAERFLATMQAGSPEYGISVKKEKSLTNFIPGNLASRFTQVIQNGQFPYCGLLINERNLSIAKDCTTSRRSGRPHMI